MKDLELFPKGLPERHIYLATEGREYSLKEINRIFGSWQLYVSHFTKAAANVEKQASKL
jgi:hypothetical protein